MHLWQIFLVGMTDFAMDLSAQKDGFVTDLWSCIFLREKMDLVADFETLFRVAKDGKHIGG